MSSLPQTERDRIFPPVTSDLYKESGGKPSNPPTDAAQRLLSLAGKKLPFRQKYLGRGLDAEGRAGRLFRFHREAMESELAGAVSRADFFWQLFHEEFNVAAGNDEFWAELAQAVVGAEGNPLSPSELRCHVVREVFVEAHLAFYEAHASGDKELTPASRAFAHFGYVKLLLPWVGLTGELLVSLLRRPLTAQMNTLLKHGCLNEASALAQMMVGLAPGHMGCQEELAYVHVVKVVSSLNNRSAARDDEQALLAGIRQLEEVRSKHPHSLKIFHLLAHLYALRSVKLANLGLLSAALVDAQKATSYHPGNEEVKKNRDELIKAMGGLQSDMREVEGRLAGQHSGVLDAWGQFLLAEAAKGFGPLEEYLRTPEPAATAEAYRGAQAYALWRDLALPAASDSGGERMRTLLEAVEGVLGASPADEQVAFMSWRAAAAQNADLASVDEACARNFLRRQLFPEAADRGQPGQDAGAAAPLFVRSRRLPSLPEPFGYWLFRRKDLGTKALAAAALLLFFFAGALWVRETRARRTRDDAYRQVVEAVEKRRYQDVLDGAESFLSHPPLSAEDGRKDKVLAFYKDSLLRFVIRQDGAELNPASAERLARYRRLAGATE